MSSLPSDRWSLFPSCLLVCLCRRRLFHLYTVQVLRAPESAEDCDNPRLDLVELLLVVEVLALVAG